MLPRRAVDVQPLVEEGAALSLPPMPPALADKADSIVIPLTGQQKTVAHLTVDVAFRYSMQADIGALRLALAKVMVKFPVLAGRAVRLEEQDDAESSTGELALCVPKFRQPIPTWAYVPFAHAEAPDDIEPPCDGIAPDNMFDLVTDCIPSESVVYRHIDGSNTGTTTSDPIDQSMLGEPLTRIRVTNYKSGCQIIALSINHTLVDAGSIGLFWSAWSEQYRTCRYGDGETVDIKVTFDHPIFSSASKEDGDERASTPDEWKALLPNEIEGAIHSMKVVRNQFYQQQHALYTNEQSHKSSSSRGKCWSCIKTVAIRRHFCPPMIYCAVKFAEYSMRPQFCCA